MWNENKSLFLSKTSVWLFAGITVAICAGTPFFLRAIGPAVMVGGKRVQDAFWQLLTVEYLAGAVACLALVWLYRLLVNIEKGRVFVHDNVRILRMLSWCCIGVGLVFVAGGLLCWPPFWLVAAVAAFAGLILRVMKNVFAQAVCLKEENDFTI